MRSAGNKKSSLTSFKPAPGSPFGPDAPCDTEYNNVVINASCACVHVCVCMCVYVYVRVLCNTITLYSQVDHARLLHLESPGRGRT